MCSLNLLEKCSLYWSKLLSNDAPQYPCLTFSWSKIANWESSIGRMASLYTAERQSSLSLLAEALSLFTKLYTQFMHTNASRSGSNQQCKCNMSWMSRWKNVKSSDIWIGNLGTGFMHNCKFFFSLSFCCLNMNDWLSSLSL